MQKLRILTYINTLYDGYDLDDLLMDMRLLKDNPRASIAWVDGLCIKPGEPETAIVIYETLDDGPLFRSDDDIRNEFHTRGVWDPRTGTYRK